MDRRLTLVLLLGITAASGLFIAAISAVVTHPEWNASLRLLAAVTDKWHHFLFGPAGQLVALTAGLVVMELLFLTWEKTTVFRVFVRRNRSAVTDLGFTFLSFSTLKWLVEYVLTLGVAFLAVGSATPWRRGSAGRAGNCRRTAFWPSSSPSPYISSARPSSATGSIACCTGAGSGTCTAFTIRRPSSICSPVFGSIPPRA